MDERAMKLPRLQQWRCDRNCAEDWSHSNNIPTEEMEASSLLFALFEKFPAFRVTFWRSLRSTLVGGLYLSER
jgi:hypothetical protein